MSKIRTLIKNRPQTCLKFRVSLTIVFLVDVLITTFASCAFPYSQSFDSIIMMLNPSMSDDAKTLFIENIGSPNIDLSEIDSQIWPGITLSEFYFDDCMLLFLLKVDADVTTGRMEIIANGEALPPDFNNGSGSENNDEYYYIIGSLGDFREAEKIELYFSDLYHYVDVSSLLLSGKNSGLKIDYLINESVTIGEVTFELESYIESAGAGILECRVNDRNYYEKFYFQMVNEEKELLFESTGLFGEAPSYIQFYTKTQENPKKRYLQFISVDTFEVLEEVPIG